MAAKYRARDQKMGGEDLIMLPLKVRTHTHAHVCDSTHRANVCIQKALEELGDFALADGVDVCERLLLIKTRQAN